MEPKWGLVGPTFQKKCENEKVRLDCAGVYGLHMSPSLKAPDATKQKNKKTYVFQVHNIFIKQNWKMIPQMCLNGVVYFGGGASWGTCGAIIRNMYPKVLQKWSQDYKSAPKIDPQMVKVGPK